MSGLGCEQLINIKSKMGLYTILGRVLCIIHGHVLHIFFPVEGTIFDPFFETIIFRKKNLAFGAKVVFFALSLDVNTIYTKKTRL